MRKIILSVFLVLATSGLVLMAPQPCRQAEASGWEWRQDDWSGGPGQPMWIDDARYSASNYVDTTSVPGTIRLSYLAHPYVKEATNPVLAPGGPGEWDRNTLQATVRPYEGGGYEALYAGYSNTSMLSALGYASSGNGVNWSKFYDNPVLEGSASAWENRGVGSGPLLQEGDLDNLWFSGFNAGADGYYGYAASADLINWDKLPDYVFGPGTAGSWDERIQAPQVILGGSEYKMYYEGHEAGGSQQIGLATSPDGVNWTRNAANPVLALGAPGSWDDTDLASFHVLKCPWAGSYLMAYSAADSLGTYGIGMAVSPDGVTWTKYAGNPVFASGTPGSFFEDGIDVTSLSFDGSMYRLFLLCRDAASTMRIVEAYSPNASAWNLSVFSPMLSVGAAGSWDEDLVVADRHYLEGNTLRTFYTGLNPVACAMGTATASPAYYSGGGWLESSIFDAGSTADWGIATWTQVTPGATGVIFQVRSGEVPSPDGTWTAWTGMANGAEVPHPDSRYLQYRVDLTSAGADTPFFSNLVIDFTALPSEWYFAEGYTGPGFDQWLTIQNPNPAEADVEVVYYTPDSVPEFRSHIVPGQSRLTINVNSDLGPGLENSCRINSSQPVICERPMYFHYSGTGGYDWEGGHCTMGSTGLSRTWYFAEGYTGEGFEEWLTIQNPENGEAIVDVTYYVNGGAPIRKRHVVGDHSRYTINVNSDVGTGLEVSAMLESDRPILVERPIYFDYMGHIDGGHIVMGSPALSDVWYLAEGATFQPFTEYITVQNPGICMATLSVTYYRNSGAPLTRVHTVEARSRYTIDAGVDSGYADEVSVEIISDMEVLVERPMYFDLLGGGQPGGHCAMGVPSPSNDWYFAEGYTGPGYDQWITIMNPFPGDAPIEVTYYTESGAPIETEHVVPGQTRYTISVGADAGDDLQLSARVRSFGVPVIVERPMYFFYQGYAGYGWPGGHDTAGFAP